MSGSVRGAEEQSFVPTRQSRQSCDGDFHAAEAIACEPK
jgi:hypothetical protein